MAGGKLLREKGVLPDIVHTSVLRRAINTANLALDACDRHWIPVRRDWRLNERHYGALQGLDKAATREKYGDEQFMLWRRSFDTRRPPIDAGSEYDQSGDPRYAGIEVPRTECLKDVIARFMPYWEGPLQDDLRTGQTVLVVAHGNSLRGLVKHLDQIGDEDIAALNIPTGQPLVYTLGDDYMPTRPGSTSTPRLPRRLPRPSPTKAASQGSWPASGHPAVGMPRGRPPRHTHLAWISSAPAAIRPAAGRTGRSRSAARPGRSPATGPVSKASTV